MAAPTFLDQVKELFGRALSLPASERPLVLDDASVAPEVRVEAQRLLDLHDQAESFGFLDAFAVDHAASMTGTSVFRSGQLLSGRFRVNSFLGRGGAGEVYEVFDELVGERVAIKTLRADVLKEPATMTRFRRELALARKVTHPNVCRVFDVFSHDDGKGVTFFFTMELLEGETLAEYLRSTGRLRPSEALGLLRQMCDGLAAVHYAGLIHRDFKSSNVFLVTDSKGRHRALVTDFGLARSESLDATSLTPGAVVMGTPAYMAPEQIEGATLSPQTDIYSLGVTCYEMVTGRQPFEGDSPMAVAVKRLKEAPRPPRDWVPDLPEHWNATILKCLARNPAARFSAATEVVSALSGAPEARLEWETPLAPSATPPRAIRQRVALVASVAALLAMLVVALGYVPGGTPDTDGRAPSAIAVLPLDNLSGNAGNDYLAAGIEDVLVTNLASVPGLVIVEPASVRAVGRRRDDVAGMAQELAVTHVLGATLQRSDDTLRVSMRLVSAEDPRVLWSRVFDGSVEDLFRLQHRLFEALLGELEARSWIVPGTVATLPAIQEEAPRSTRTLEDYSRARLLLDRADSTASLEAAAKLLEDIVAAEPTFALGHALLGQAYWAAYRRTEDVELVSKARDAAVEALRLRPDLAGVRYALAVIYYGTGRTKEATDELRAVLARQPAHDGAYRFLGQIYGEQGELDEAIAAIQTAMDLRPGFAGNYGDLGLVYFFAGRYREAAAAFARETELDPDNASALQRLGTAYHANGDLNRARNSYEKVIALAPSATAFSNLGTIYYAERRFDDALSAYQRSVGLEPSVASSHLNLGDAYHQLGRRADAERAYRDAAARTDATLEVNALDASALSLKALCLAKLGDFSEAEDASHAALELSPEDGDILYNEAVIAALLGDEDRALDYLDAALTNGYPRIMARDDPDLDALYSKPRFRALLERR